MALRYIPVLLRHSPTPRTEHFALLTGLDAAVRGTLISVMPLLVYDAMGTAEGTSQVYFIAGIISLVWGLLVPGATRLVPRRWMYTLGCLLYFVSMALAVAGGPVLVPLAVVFSFMATVTTFVCLNAYVLDYVSRSELGRNQSLQMVYAAAPWAIGPLLGVWLRGLWAPAPFVVAGMFAAVILVTFWVLRLGNGKQIVRARAVAVNPLVYLVRFLHQPRLIAGWLFAVLRSCGWWVYVVYLPIFCIEAGLSDKVGGAALSISNVFLFIAPLMMRFVQRVTVRRAVRWGFFCSAALFTVSGLAAPMPWAVVGLMLGASLFLVLLDVVGGLPFLMAVKPSERTEMAAVYSTFRDVSGIVTPGAAWLILLVAPLQGVFVACGLGLGVAYAIAARLHPRLGAARPSHGVQMPGE